jgi:transposase-like protein
MKCKFCESEDIAKNGFVRGKQRYICNDCGKTFTLGDRRKSNVASEMIFDLLCCVEEVKNIKTKEELVGIFSKHFGVSRRTINQWINRRECDAQLSGVIREFGSVDYVKKEYIDREKDFLCAAVSLDDKANAIIIVQRKD